MPVKPDLGPPSKQRENGERTTLRLSPSCGSPSPSFSAARTSALSLSPLLRRSMYSCYTLCHMIWAAPVAVPLISIGADIRRTRVYRRFTHCPRSPRAIILWRMARMTVYSRSDEGRVVASARVLFINSCRFFPLSAPPAKWISVHLRCGASCLPERAGPASLRATGDRVIIRRPADGSGARDAMAQGTVGGQSGPLLVAALGVAGMNDLARP